MPVKGQLSKMPRKASAYILDACPEDEDDGFKVMSIHYQKQRIMRLLHERHIDCEVCAVSFAPNAQAGDVLKYFTQQFATKTRNELTILYYHGNAGSNGKSYTWRFEKYPDQDINAYELILFFVNSGLDVFII